MRNILVPKIFVACCLIGSLQAVTLDPLHSLIFLPKPGSITPVSRPIIAGIMVDKNRKPLKNKQVTVYADGQIVGIAKTDKTGVWSYQLNASQKFKNGSHFAQASISLSNNNYWAQATIFSVHRTRDDQSTYKSGNVSTTNSAIVFPFDSSYIDTATPTVVVNLLDSGFNAVSGETVTLKIDSSTIGSDSSDSNGMIALMTTSIIDAAHTADAHCAESSVDLATINFTIDTTAPAAPTIATPTQNQTVATSLVSVSGTTEANATITTFMDGDTYGDISYADESGNWSIDYTLSNAAHSVTAQVSDLANNASVMSAARDFTVNA